MELEGIPVVAEAAPAASSSSSQQQKQQQQQQGQRGGSAPQQQPQKQGKVIVRGALANYLSKTQHLLHVKRFHEALAVLAKAANLQPDGSALAIVNVLRADAYCGLLDLGSGVACLRSALLSSKHESEQTQIRARLVHVLDTAAVSLLQRGQCGPAHQMAQEASELDTSGSLEVHLHRCLCLVGLQRLEEASNEFAALRFAAETVGNKPVALECTVMSVQLSIVQRQFEEAKAFLEACSRQQVDGTAWSDHPRIIELEREFDNAFQAFIKEAKANGDIEALSMCIRCFPSDPELYRNRAIALVERGNFAQGIQDYFKCIEKNAGKDDEAQRAVARTLYIVAHQLVENSDMGGAITYLSESIKWNPDAIDVILLRGDCLVQLREHQAALGDFQRAQQLDPESPEVRTRISNLHNMWGSHLFNEHKYRAAEEEYTKAINISPFEPRYFYFRARCRLQSAESPVDHMLGVRDLIECRNLGTDDPDILLLISQLCPSDGSGGGGGDDDDLNSSNNGAFATTPPPAATTASRSSASRRHPAKSRDSMMSVVPDQDEDAVAGLRGNRAELLASPIDSKKLREASASITDPETFKKSLRGGPIWLKHGETEITIKPRLQRHDFHASNKKYSVRDNNSNKKKTSTPTIGRGGGANSNSNNSKDGGQKQRMTSTTTMTTTSFAETKSKKPPPKVVSLPPLMGVNVL